MMKEFEDIPVRQEELRRERLTILAVVVLLLSAAAVPQVFKNKRQHYPALSPTTQPAPMAELRGMTLQLHSYWEGIPFEQYVREIAQSGANTICLSIAAYQENCSSSSLFIEYRKVPSLSRLERLIRLAHKMGLRVVLMPIVLLEDPGPGEWRGKIIPLKPEHWWEDYENYILFYAQLAQKTNVEVLIIGSELVSLEDETQHWRTLIRKVRNVYKGKLSYSASWDHYEQIEWWKDLDIIGMTVYYDLVGNKKPTLDVLLEAWKPIKKHILEWRRKIGKPIMFTEVGWPNQVGCAKEPWNYYVNPDKPDPIGQANCFEAFFRTWHNVPEVAGILIWEWRNHPSQTGGPNDTSYIPIGKPAMKVIQRYFAAGRGKSEGTSKQFNSKPSGKSNRMNITSHKSNSNPLMR
ncbi:MAG: hypothetical protein J7L99_01800 [Planctomycetes bacterium]|nr:hypothetical protein [Planctomycetota bacterium]